MFSKKIAICGNVAALALSAATVQRAHGSQVPLTVRKFRLSKNVATLRQMKTRYLVFQEYDFSCGAAVVSTLLTYYFGEPANEKEVIAGIFKRSNVELVIKRRAFSLLDMKRFAQARGYQAIGYRMNFEFLSDLSKEQPVIVPVTIRDYDHFVIVKGVVGDRVVIADPALGNYTMRVGKFMPIWKGGIGFVLKKKNPKGPMANKEMKYRFLASSSTRRVAMKPNSTFIPIPGQVQSITGPSPAGGSFTNSLGGSLTP